MIAIRVSICRFVWFRISDVRSGVLNVGFRLSSFETKVSATWMLELGLHMVGVGFSALGLRISDSWVSDSGLLPWEMGFGVSNFRVVEFRVWNSDV